MTTFAEYLNMADKTYGEGTLTLGSQQRDTNHIPTGIFTLDFALHGGIPEGKMTEFVGWEGSGKSTAALMCVANYQAKYQEKIVLLADTEDAFDRDWAAQLGVDLDRLLLINENSAEKLIDIIDGAKDVDEIGMVLVDSLAEMMPTSELQKSAVDNQKIAYRALIVGKLITTISAVQLYRNKKGSNMTFLLINQQRTNPAQMFGDNTVIPGGKQQVFKATVIVRFSLKKKHSQDTAEGVKDVHVRNDHAFKIKKSRLGASITDGEFELVCGPNQEVPIGTISDHEVVLGYMKKYGHYTGGGQARKIEGCDEVFKNKDEAANYLRQNEHFFKMCKARLIALQRLEANKQPVPPDNYLITQIPEGWEIHGVS